MARWIESWLPGSPAGSGDRPGGHRGERFGLPASGHYSVAGFGRRVLALCIDWLLAYLLVLLVGGAEALATTEFRWWVLGTWFVVTVLMVAVLGATPGHLALRMRVARTDMGQQVGIPKALIRTAMIAVVLPPFFLDSDGRGWHDRASTTIVVRTAPA
ncbi:RDD family protein [Pseudonocardia sp. HH130630-07]|uniref:RDD family protein n=1 Tax=Pseudonocardia sp. HH130630-07 TaxID=1690815 RepID=UPI000814CED2|nr:RDD family protein [Pseudonocardia sp. HH130630-07]ANY05206.1 hypothetical protein AFB00_01510 [Pseudonocardia sp. HH130630-07]